jgi:quercetin dioxygenase-like cupin family protein
MRRTLGVTAVLCLTLSCSSGSSEGHGPGHSDRSAFGPESGAVDDTSTEYDLRSARFRPLGDMTADVEVLYGHPDSVGRPFVIRIRELPGTIIPPHSHPVDEHITVVQGTWYFGLGETFDTTALQRLTTGAYAFAPAGSTMFAYSPDFSVVQVHGVGPFHIDWRESVHVLSEPGTDRMFRYRIGQRVDTPRGPGEIRQGYRSGAIIQYEVVGDSLPLFMVNEGEVRLTGSQ